MLQITMIVADHLTRRFGRICAVDAACFEIPRGTVVGFLGPNGAGKTTTIRMLCGYLRPSGGIARIDGLDVQEHPMRTRRMLGYLPESAPLYPEMRVTEYLRYRARLFGMPRRDRESAIGLALDRCNLTDVQRRPIGQLSKGYRQRVGLASAILHQPPVLILDEPTVGLDPAQIRQVRSLIAELAGDHTILLSTHILPEVELTCQRYLIIAGGKIRRQGSIESSDSARSGDDCVIELQTPTAGKLMSAVAGVARVEVQSLEDGWHRVSVVAKPGTSDLRPLLAQVAQDASIPMRELSRERSSLEALFMQVMRESESDGAAPEQSGPSNTPEPKQPLSTKRPDDDGDSDDAYKPRQRQAVST